MARSGATKVAVFLVAGIILVNVVLAIAAEVLGPGPGGPTSSSFATAHDGLAGYEELLRRQGRPVVKLRRSLAETGLPPSTTVVLADPGPAEEEQARALGDFVEQGGRLVVTGPSGERWLELALGRAPSWSGTGVTAQRPIAPVPENAGVTIVGANGVGSWDEPRGALPIMGRGRDATALLATPGLGTVVMIADTSVLQNRYLGHFDNAAFALGIAGEDSRPVVFVESVHGFGEATGLTAIPLRWRAAFVALGIAAIMWLVARGRRFGPPEPETRDLPPPRKVFVDAMATTLMRSRQRDDALAGVRSAVRDSLARRGGLPADADAESIKRVGVGAGLDESELRAILEGIRTDDDALAAGRALVKVRGTR